MVLKCFILYRAWWFAEYFRFLNSSGKELLHFLVCWMSSDGTSLKNLSSVNLFMLFIVRLWKKISIETAKGFYSNTGQRCKKLKLKNFNLGSWYWIAPKIALYFFLFAAVHCGYILRDVSLLFLQAVPNQQRTGQLAPGIRSPPLPTDYLVEINKVLLSMDATELLLNAPELSTVAYEDFSFQEDSLKVNLQVPDLNSHS